VNSGGTLGGVGTVSAITVQGGGFFSPGDSRGTLTAASLSLAAGSTFVEQLGGTSAGRQYDQTVIQAGGIVSLDGATLNISFLGSFRPSVGQQFTIIDNQSGSSVIGTFSQGSTYTLNGYIFGINYAGGAGDDVVLTVLARRTLAGSNNSTQGVGSHTSTASFIESNGSLNSGATMPQPVNQTPTTPITVTSSLIASSFGQSVTFTTTVSPSPWRRGGKSAIGPGTRPRVSLITMASGAGAFRWASVRWKARSDG
jgi:hypothetical protein